MKSIRFGHLKTVFVSVACGLLVYATGAPAMAQGIDQAPLGVPQDWSHRNVIHSNPDSREQAEAKGTLDEWNKKANDPRFIRQLERKEASEQASTDAAKAMVTNIRAQASTDAAKVVTAKAKKTPLPTSAHGIDWKATVNTADPAAGTQGFANHVFPAKFSFSATSTPTCGDAVTAGDFVVFPLNLAGSATQANIIAYNNLYSGTTPPPHCTGADPSVMWAYNASGNAITTSPVLSLTGNAVAWVDGTAATVTLRVLRWRLGDGATGSFPNAVQLKAGLTTPADCTTTAGTPPCIFNVPISTDSTVSGSLFVNYANDSAYVTDSIGYVYKIRNIFNGTVAPSTAWGTTFANGRVRNSTASKFSPVYDFSGSVFAIDVNGNIDRVVDVPNPSTPATPTTLNVGASLGAVSDGLLLSIGDDAANDRIFAFAENNTAKTNAVVVQVRKDAVSPFMVIAATANVGQGEQRNVPTGAFDNRYQGGTPSSGFLYVAGHGVENKNRPALYRIGFTSYPTMNTAATGPLELMDGQSEASPLTQIFNTAQNTDWLFLSVGNRCKFTVANEACIASFDITSAFPTTASAAQPLESAAGPATGGIVVDNVSPLGQASSIYFGTVIATPNPSNATISQVQRTSNVATITTAAAHNFVMGDTVVITITNNGATANAFTGTFTVTSTPTSTTFTYNQTLADAAATPVTVNTRTAVVAADRFTAVKMTQSGLQ